MTINRRDNFSEFRQRTVPEGTSEGPLDWRPENLISPALIEYLERTFPDRMGPFPSAMPTPEVMVHVRLHQGRQEVISHLRNLLKKGYPNVPLEAS
jgi:hypothetical protein